MTRRWTCSTRGDVEDRSLSDPSVATPLRMTEALNRARLHGVAQGLERLMRRHELVRHEAADVRVGDRARHGVPVELLRIVQLMPSRNTAGVKMTDVLAFVWIVRMTSPSMICM